ncbi:unnamed protein product [Allacma fusca]|uniref:Uncharacterized protein n=1 Tax=Allacma fusca TaxID=39272 RepID=A0A8J2PHC0_9HEXA|nr:unnamed protein product [Allacma fusca]
MTGSTASAFEVFYDTASIFGYLFVLVFKMNTFLFGREVCDFFNLVNQADFSIEAVINYFSVEPTQRHNRSVRSKISNQMDVSSSALVLDETGCFDVVYSKIETIWSAVRMSRNTGDFWTIVFLFTSWLESSFIIPVNTTMVFLKYRDTERYLYGLLPQKSFLLPVFVAYESLHVYFSVNHVLFYFQMCFVIAQNSLQSLAKLRLSDCQDRMKKLRMYKLITILVGMGNECLGIVNFLHAFGMAPHHIICNVMMVRYLGELTISEYLIFPTISIGCTFVAVTMYGMAGSLTKLSTNFLESFKNEKDVTPGHFFSKNYKAISSEYRRDHPALEFPTRFTL